MDYTIGEVAKKLKLAPSTLRYYDKEGLLPFVERKDSDIPIFSDTVLQWLDIIECLKITGMSIKDIKIFIDWCTDGDTALQKTMSTINYKSGTEKIHQDIKPGNIPELTYTNNNGES